MSIQSARGRKGDSVEAKPLPAKPEEVRYSIVCLYGAAFISVCFLLLNGEVQWYEDTKEMFSMMRLALAHMAVSAVADAGLAYAMSRFMRWTRPVVMVCTAISLVINVMTFQDLVILSPGFSICRNLTLLMELCAVLLLMRKASKNWFQELAK